MSPACYWFERYAEAVMSGHVPAHVLALFLAKWEAAHAASMVASAAVLSEAQLINLNKGI